MKIEKPLLSLHRPQNQFDLLFADSERIQAVSAKEMKRQRERELLSKNLNQTMHEILKIKEMIIKRKGQIERESSMWVSVELTGDGHGRVEFTHI